MEIRKVWCINRLSNGNVFLNFFDTGKEAVAYAISLPEKDKKDIRAIHETMAAVNRDGSYEEVWSEDYQEVNSLWWRANERFINGEELQELIGD